MKISHIISHKSHEHRDAQERQEHKKAPSATNDKFSEEKLISAAINFAEVKGRNTGMRFMQELNFRDVNRHHKSEADRKLNLSEGTALFLAFDQKIYTPDDNYVKDADIRVAITKNLQKEYPQGEIFWLETVGVAEPGSGFYATVPIWHITGVTVAAGFGFSAGTILRYRTSQAVLGDPTNKNKTFLSSLKALPTNAEAAGLMQAGQEFEFCGQGKLRADANLGIRTGADVGVYVAGIGENAGLVECAALEYGINVLALGDHKVRVTIRKIDQESLAAVSNTALGLIIPANKLFPGNNGLPSFGHGLLKYFVEHKGPPAFEAYLTDYTSLTLNCSLTKAHKHVSLCSYDIDLNNTQAAQAYNLLMRLDPSKAEALVPDGVTKISLSETQFSHKAAARLTLCTEKIFLKEALKSESHGKLLNAQGQHKVYRDEAFKKHYENWFSGKKDALWEGVQVKVDDQEAKTYYHFNYQKNDFITHQKEVDRFFKFAHALGIKQAASSNSKIISMPLYKKIFSSADDSKLDVDLYFTSEGVERIRACEAHEIAQAYLIASAKLENKNTLHPLVVGDEKLKKSCQSIYDRYHMYRYTHRFIRTPYQINGQALMKLFKEYQDLCARDLVNDYRAIKKARRFAELAEQLLTKEQDRHKIAKFFTSLGHSRFSYAQGIATLTSIAGRENVLVHTLNASGGGLVLKSKDEGVIAHPRIEAVKQTLR